MPWKETSSMAQQITFIGDVQRGLLPVTERAERVGTTCTLARLL